MQILDEIMRIAAVLFLKTSPRVFGVPTFIAGDELFWGNDRLILLRHYLTQVS
jgi:2-hydroxychromene-2-carboxylate isomerase